MVQYCVMLPIRKGTQAEVLGDRVFHCQVNNNMVDILDDNTERKIYETTLDKVKIVDFKDVYFKEDTTMWLS